MRWLIGVRVFSRGGARARREPDAAAASAARRRCRARAIRCSYLLVGAASAAAGAVAATPLDDASLAAAAPATPADAEEPPLLRPSAALSRMVSQRTRTNPLAHTRMITQRLACRLSLRRRAGGLRE